MEQSVKGNYNTIQYTDTHHHHHLTLPSTSLNPTSSSSSLNQCKSLDAKAPEFEPLGIQQYLARTTQLNDHGLASSSSSVTDADITKDGSTNTTPSNSCVTLSSGQTTPSPSSTPPPPLLPTYSLYPSLFSPLPSSSISSTSVDASQQQQVAGGGGDKTSNQPYYQQQYQPQPNPKKYYKKESTTFSPNPHSYSALPPPPTPSIPPPSHLQYRYFPCSSVHANQIPQPIVQEMLVVVQTNINNGLPGPKKIVKSLRKEEDKKHVRRVSMEEANSIVSDPFYCGSKRILLVPNRKGIANITLGAGKMYPSFELLLKVYGIELTKPDISNYNLN